MQFDTATLYPQNQNPKYSALKKLTLLEIRKKIVNS
jgi:hypothetical protein